VQDLDRRYPELLAKTATVGHEPDENMATVTSQAGVLDLSTVMKASQAISSEIVLDRLLKKLMRIVIENAGAQRGFLILEDRNQLFIEAEGAVDKEDVIAMQSVPVDTNSELSMAIVNYVARTQESVVLHDAAGEGLFRADAYVVKTRPKSVLCAPLVNQGRLAGIIYLENNLTSGAFTPARLEVLSLLSAEIAISVDNARLYNSLEQKVEERTEQLRKSNDDLNAAYQDLKAAQVQLVHAEKMASLGQLTAGIAHEIKNPLNFVNNFATTVDELADELVDELTSNKKKPVAQVLEDVEGLVTDLKTAAQMVNKHGQRADSIIRSMMQHAHTSSNERVSTNVNQFVEEYVSLTYHGMRAQQSDFNVSIETSYDEAVGSVEMVPQDIGRVLVNLLNNAYYAVTEKRKSADESYEPTVTVGTTLLRDTVEIRVGDNGDGIPVEIREKIFEPFYTTKPAGSGTGLGLSLSYDIIVVQHGGSFELKGGDGEGATFVITLGTS
jgi:C4-dicarboxylate-specific signal transduction histidine kinase